MPESEPEFTVAHLHRGLRCWTTGTAGGRRMQLLIENTDGDQVVEVQVRKAAALQVVRPLVLRGTGHASLAAALEGVQRSGVPCIVEESSGQAAEARDRDRPHRRRRHRRRLDASKANGRSRSGSANATSTAGSSTRRPRPVRSRRRSSSSGATAVTSSCTSAFPERDVPTSEVPPQILWIGSNLSILTLHDTEAALRCQPSDVNTSESADGPTGPASEVARRGFCVIPDALDAGRGRPPRRGRSNA